MEEEVYAKNKELKEMNKLKEDIRILKQMEEAMSKKISSSEGANHDQMMRIKELEDYKKDIDKRVQQMVQDLDKALLHGHSVGDQLNSITDKYHNLERMNDKLTQDIKQT
jgi:chromosome segregation ATPase